MSLRDFNNAPFSDDPTALHNAPSGNGAGLDSFHTVQPEDIEPNNLPKIVGAVAVALMVGVAGVALYAHSGNQPKPMVAASNLPPAPQPAPVAMTPDVPASTPEPQASPQAVKAAKAATTDPNSLRAAEIKTPTKTASLSHKSMPTSSDSTAAISSAAADRLAADSTQSTTQPQQQAVAAPVSPQPSPSDVATINTQSGAAVPQGATTAADIPAQPQSPTPEQPTAQQAGQQPAAAQSAGQVAQ